MKTIFNFYVLFFHLYIFLKKILVNKYEKQMRHKENKSQLFDVMKKSQVFSSKVCDIQYDHKFLLSREMGSIRTSKEVRLQKRVSPFHFLQNVLIETSNVCFENFQISYLLYLAIP